MAIKLKPAIQFGLCIDNKGYAVSLEVGKLYRVVPDDGASQHGYVRVVDESGEDYAYSAERFFVLKLPEPIAHALSGGSSRGDRLHKAMQPAAQKARRG